jgi:hypothetical protein
MPAFDSQFKAQRFVLMMVAKGYQYYLSGVATAKEELDNRHRQYREFYHCDLSPAEKIRRKKKGLANTHFVTCPLPPDELDGGYLWILLATDGVGEVRENKKLRDGWDKGQRMTWGDYVMVQTTREKNAKGQGGGERWSFYLKPDVKRLLDKTANYYVKNEPTQLRGFFEAQVRRPMHFGIRNALTRMIKRTHQHFTMAYPGRPWPARDPGKPLPIIDGFK